MTLFSQMAAECGATRVVITDLADVTEELIEPNVKRWQALRSDIATRAIAMPYDWGIDAGTQVPRWSIDVVA